MISVKFQVIPISSDAPKVLQQREMNEKHVILKLNMSFLQHILETKLTVIETRHSSQKTSLL